MYTNRAVLTTNAAGHAGSPPIHKKVYRLTTPSVQTGADEEAACKRAALRATVHVDKLAMTL